jgi:adenylate cyclase class IV
VKETEVKILEVDRPALEAKLEALGAKRVLDADMTALFYTGSTDRRPETEVDATSSSRNPARGGDAASTVSRYPSPVVLRLREEGPRTFLTLKGPITQGAAKVRDEYEIEVSDSDTTKLILRALGLKPASKVRKHRVAYELKNVRFAFDRYLDDLSFIPEFLEIEGPDVITIYAYVLKLGLSIGDCRPWATVDLINHYRSRAPSQPPLR